MIFGVCVKETVEGGFASWMVSKTHMLIQQKQWKHYIHQNFFGWDTPISSLSTSQSWRIWLWGTQPPHFTLFCSESSVWLLRQFVGMTKKTQFNYAMQSHGISVWLANKNPNFTSSGRLKKLSSFQNVKHLVIEFCYYLTTKYKLGNFTLCLFFFLLEALQID